MKPARKCRYCKDALEVFHSGYCAKHGGREFPEYAPNSTVKARSRARSDLDAWAKANRHDWNEGPR